jgi:hypothetical protein
MPTIVIDEIARQHNGESKDLQINPYMNGFRVCPKHMYICTSFLDPLISAELTNGR